MLKLSRTCRWHAGAEPQHQGGTTWLIRGAAGFGDQQRLRRGDGLGDDGHHRRQLQQDGVQCGLG